MIVARAAVPHGQPANSGLDLEQVKWVEGTAYGLPVTLSILHSPTHEGHFDLVAEVNGFHIGAHPLGEDLANQPWTRIFPEWLKNLLAIDPKASRHCAECYGLGWVEEISITGWSIEREETIEVIDKVDCRCVQTIATDAAKREAQAKADAARFEREVLDAAIDGIPF